MGRVTIYLDDDVEAKVGTAAKAMNTSLRQWITNAIKENTANFWPESVKELAGAWSNFPEPEEIRSGIGEDAPRQTS